MNLKESFRYQNFLDVIMSAACRSISNRYHGVEITKKHLKSKTNPNAEDEVETVKEEDYFPNDNVVKLIKTLIDEKEGVSIAIGKAKHKADIDIDAAIESNKYRHEAVSALKSLLSNKASVTKEQGRDYKFNAEGNQVPYYYEVEVSKSEAFDRIVSKDLMRNLNDTADEVSNNIDLVLVNVQVDFQPRFDVNDTFEDIMTSFAGEEPA